MRLKHVAILVVGFVSMSVIGCGSHVTRKDYNRDVAALKKYNKQLEQEAKDLRKYKQAYDSLKDRLLIDETEAKMMGDLRTALLRTLQGMNLNTTDIQYDPKTGKWTMAADLLFVSGSFKISQKGSRVLKKFALAYRKKNVLLRIVGHTDRDPIAKATTKRILHTDNNMELGALRSCMVYMTLGKFGMPSTKMFIESWGNNHPIAPNDNRPANKRKNRRVEIYVLAKRSASARPSR